MPHKLDPWTCEHCDCGSSEIEMNDWGERLCPSCMEAWLEEREDDACDNYCNP